jgi:uncharacterized membrane protein
LPTVGAAGYRGASTTNLEQNMNKAGLPFSFVNWSTRLWFVVNCAGQLMFGAYVAVLYGGATLHGKPADWNTVMTHGYVAGEPIGNHIVAAHLLVATIIMLGGALQLVPALRARAPAFHRWNGRVYLAGAVVASLSGIYMLWFRGAVGDLSQHLGTSINGLLILLCVAQTLRHAVAGNFAAHRRWALRLYLCVSGVWYFRVGLMCWIAVNGGPAGFDPDSFTGPVLSFLAFAQYLLPLAVLEVYLRGRHHARTAARVGTAGMLLLSTAVTGVGVVVATLGMWLPHM